MFTLATSLLLISQVSAGVLSNVGQLVRRDDSVASVARRYVDSIVEPIPAIERRQTSGTGVNATEWDAQTTAACNSALTALNGVANNPSGMAVCYNLPYLQNSTGVFEADLRLYMVAAPTGDFASIASSNVQVGLTYTGATVSAVNASSLKRGVDAGGVSLISWPRDDSRVMKRVTPTLVQAYAFVGQINKDLLATNMDTAALQKVLVPEVTLTGQSSTGAKVNTSLTSSEANFVSGVFSVQEVVATKAQVSPPIQTLVVASASPFVVPGINIMIFPIGGIITGIWTILFITTLAYGTFGRIQFREQFRRRTANASKGSLSRI